MHPARSIVLFTTLSGAGYGALALLGALGAAGALPASGGFPWVAGAMALALCVAGLCASTFHLRHPERAWRALSQWRSSWLSREGVAALATFGPAVAFLGGWIACGTATIWVALAGLATAVGALATVACTAMIYRSLWAVPAWHNRWTLPVFLGFALASGGLVLVLAGSVANLADGSALAPVAGPAFATALIVVIAAGLKGVAWTRMAAAEPASDGASAVGLSGRARSVALLEAPNSAETWLTREMAFRIARRHAAKLRRLAGVLWLGATLPLVLLAGVSGGVAGLVLAAGAVSTGLLAVLVERWLFFAEARHKVTLYHGADAV